jgi:hypothetical protein
MLSLICCVKASLVNHFEVAGNQALCNGLRVTGDGLFLIEPVANVHLAQHHHRRGEMLVGLLRLSRSPVKLAHAQVAVSHDRAHTMQLG